LDPVFPDRKAGKMQSTNILLSPILFLQYEQYEYQDGYGRTYRVSIRGGYYLNLTMDNWVMRYIL
jgi:hypothetical protein